MGNAYILLPGFLTHIRKLLTIFAVVIASLTISANSSYNPRRMMWTCLVDGSGGC
jgi:hypothetical protein